LASTASKVAQEKTRGAAKNRLWPAYGRRLFQLSRKGVAFVASRASWRAMEAIVTIHRKGGTQTKDSCAELGAWMALIF
jgi:hypothetical protein